MTVDIRQAKLRRKWTPRPGRDLAEARARWSATLYAHKIKQHSHETNQTRSDTNNYVNTVLSHHRGILCHACTSLVAYPACRPNGRMRHSCTPHQADNYQSHMSLHKTLRVSKADVGRRYPELTVSRPHIEAGCVAMLGFLDLPVPSEQPERRTQTEEPRISGPVNTTCCVTHLSKPRQAQNIANIIANRGPRQRTHACNGIRSVSWLVAVSWRCSCAGGAALPKSVGGPTSKIRHPQCACVQSHVSKDRFLYFGRLCDRLAASACEKKVGKRRISERDTARFARRRRRRTSRYKLYKDRNVQR